MEYVLEIFQDSISGGIAVFKTLEEAANRMNEEFKADPTVSFKVTFENLKVAP